MDDSLAFVSQVSVRIRRLYACACYDFVRSFAQSEICDQAVDFAYKTHDDIERQRFWARYLAHQEKSNDLKTLIARRLAEISVSNHVDAAPLLSCVWGIRTILSETFDEKLLQDLNFSGSNRKVWTPKAEQGHIVALAQEMYEGNRDACSILADAIDDSGLCSTWSTHLRVEQQHWKGCWVIDNLLGKG